MHHLSSHETMIVFISLATLLAISRAFGEIAKRLNQPSVLGELLAGILLGPTILGRISPDLMTSVFPREGGAALMASGLSTLSIAFFLLIVGLEINLSSVFKLGRSAVYVSAGGILIPCIMGLAAAWMFPAMLGRDKAPDKVVFDLFLATALSLSSLAVISKTLLDLKLFQTNIGRIVMAAAVIDDLVGWSAFAVILGMIETAGGHTRGLAFTLGLAVGFTVFMLTVGRKLIDKGLAWVLTHMSWPGGVLSYTMVIAFACAATTEWIGVHAIIGTFLAGIALGDSPHMQHKSRDIIEQFVSHIFAPLFFASIGLMVDFSANFDPVLCGILFAIACLGKILGGSVSARMGGISWRDAWAVGMGMNTRGGMTTTLGIVALQYEIIDERMFVALVLVGLGTSVVSGPAMQRILKLRRHFQLSDFLHPKTYLGFLKSEKSIDVISELATAASAACGVPQEEIVARALDHEHQCPSGIGCGIATPQAQIRGLSKPIVAVGLSGNGVDFHSQDGTNAHLVFLLLTPESDHGEKTDLVSQVSHVFSAPGVRQEVFRAHTYREFLGVVKAHSH